MSVTCRGLFPDEFFRLISQRGCSQSWRTSVAFTSLLSAHACSTVFPRLSVKFTSAPAVTEIKQTRCACCVRLDGLEGAILFCLSRKSTTEAPPLRDSVLSGPSRLRCVRWSQGPTAHNFIWSLSLVTRGSHSTHKERRQEQRSSAATCAARRGAARRRRPPSAGWRCSRAPAAAAGKPRAPPWRPARGAAPGWRSASGSGCSLEIDSSFQILVSRE